MHKEVKDSLNAIFEKQGIHDEMERGERKMSSKKRIWMPTFAAVGIMMIALFLFLNPFTKIDHNTSSFEQQSNIFDYKNVYIGDNSAMSYIVSYVLGNNNYSHIALQTKEEPYGLTVHSNQTIVESLRMKTALYVFTLVQNADYIQFETEGRTDIIQKADLEEMYQINLTDIQDEDTLNAIYTEHIAINDRPTMLHAQKEHIYKVLFNARSKAKEQAGIANIANPQYMYHLDGELYYLWLTEESGMFIKQSDTHKMYLLTDESLAELHQLLDNDMLVITGEIVEINDDRIFVKQSDNIMNDGEYDAVWALVDDGASFTVGQQVSVWASFVNESNRIPQASATRTQVK